MRPLRRGWPDLRRDGVGYRIAGMWLDEDELAELSAVLQPRLRNPPKAGGTRRLLATVVLPGRPPAG